MRTVPLHIPQPGHSHPSRVARLARHLKARLLDFGPGGPEVVLCDQENGIVTARFPGHDTAAVVEQLVSLFGISAAQEGDCAVFYLTDQTPFEDLDYVWGCLFDLL